MLRTSIRYLLTGFVGLLALSSVARTAEDPMSDYYGNTLVCQSISMQCHIWFAPDGSYRRFEATKNKDGTVSIVGVEGHYETSQQDGRTATCLVPRNVSGPIGTRPTQCYVLTGHHIGEQWDASDTQQMVHFTLLAGHHVNGGINIF